MNSGKISVISQSARKSPVDGRYYWPRVSGKFGKSPHMSWSNVPPDCKFVSIKIIDMGGEGEFADEGAGFVHLQLDDIPANEIMAIPASGADALSQRFGRPNSHGELGYFPLNPPHPPHYYALEVSACGQRSQIIYPYPPPSTSNNK